MKDNVQYLPLDESNVSCVVEKYVSYYNNCEDGCWTLDKANRRIRQVLYTPDSYCIVQKVDGQISGFVMGYYKQFDDLLAYFLEEIVIFDGYQRQGLGTSLMLYLEDTVVNNGVEHIEFLSVSDQLHENFYGKLGYYNAKNLVIKGKHFEVNPKV